MLNLRSFNISRLEAPEGQEDTAKRAFSPTGSAICGFLETATPQFAAMNEGEYGRTYRLFSDSIDADLQIGDRLTEGSDIYDVKGVMKTVDGPGRRLEAVLFKATPQ